MSSSKRHFTVVINSKEHGLYISSTPSSAARKAVSKLCAENKNKKVEFYMRETTQGSNKKIYGPYLGEMKKLDKPIELKGRIIQYTVNVHLKKKNSTTKTSKKVGNKLRGGRIEDNGIFEPDDFIFPISYLNTSLTTKIKKNKLRGNQICFFVRPKIIDNEKIYYKYVAYYSNKHRKPRFIYFDFFTKDIIEIDIRSIPKDEDGYEFLKTLVNVLPTYSDQPPDFINTVKIEFDKRPNPYNLDKDEYKKIEAKDFIFPIDFLNTFITTRTKNNKSKQIYFFIMPKLFSQLNNEERKVLYKYAIYYSNKHKKPIVIRINNDGIFEEINIKKIPNNEEGYEVLRILKDILSTKEYHNESPDFKRKVEEEFIKRPYPYLLKEEFNNTESFSFSNYKK